VDLFPSEFVIFHLYDDDRRVVRHTACGVAMVKILAPIEFFSKEFKEQQITALDRLISS